MTASVAMESAPEIEILPHCDRRGELALVSSTARRIQLRPVHWKAMTGNLFDDPVPSAEVASEGFTAHCDGGSRGNPGPSGYGAVVEDSQGRVVARLSEFLGVQTNNFAEYSGLLAVLRWAVDNRAKRLCVVSDSELMVKQMKSLYKVIISLTPVGADVEF